MGYKLAGYTVLGNCEIDPKIAAVYEANHHPKYSFQMDIREFNKRTDIPEELLDLDILDGSPPCSTFSMAGSREEGWNKEKVFREGQKKQRLDDLFFAFIETTEKLGPKVFVAENVKGLITGKARGYVNEVIKGFQDIGYTVQLFLLDSSLMGVPQKRERVFFIGAKKELGFPKLVLNFCEKPVTFGEVRTEHGIPLQDGIMKELVARRKPGDSDLSDVCKRERGKSSMYLQRFAKDGKPSPTVTAGASILRFCDGERFSDMDCVNVQTFPQDFDFSGQPAMYVTGMSVPPVMMANVADQINKQWFEKSEKSIKSH